MGSRPLQLTAGELAYYELYVGNGSFEFVMFALLCSNVDLFYFFLFLFYLIACLVMECSGAGHFVDFNTLHELSRKSCIMYYFL